MLDATATPRSSDAVDSPGSARTPDRLRSPASTADQTGGGERRARATAHLVGRIGSALGGARTARVLVVLAVVVAVVVAAPTAMSPVARLCLAVFAVMLGLTAFTKLHEVAICSTTLAALVAIGGSSLADVTASFTSSTVWLLVGAFVVAAGAKRSGVAERLAFAIGRRATSVDGLLFRITGVLIATAFIVPSTSGRAALMLPVYLAFAERIDDRRVRRALAVLFPSAILLSAVASLFGAGAHLVTVELAVASGGRSLGFLEWAIYGLPFAAVSSLVALAVVRAMFLDRVTRALPVDLCRESTRWSRDERIVTGVLSVLMVLWLTEGLHPLPAWAAALGGALLVVVGPLRVVSMSQARSALPLDLLFIMIATAEAGAALARSGAADWVASSLLSPVVGDGSSALAVVLVVGLVSLLAHLVITSRTARASVLIPVVVLIAGAGGLDVTALAFLSTTAAGYCLTTTTSAKPIRVFSSVDDGYDEADLRRLSLRLLPLHMLLLLGFAFVVWPTLGLALDRDATDRADGGTRAGYPWRALVVDDLGVGPRLASSPVAAAGSSPTFDEPIDPLAPPVDGDTRPGVAGTTGVPVGGEDVDEQRDPTGDGEASGIETDDDLTDQGDADDVGRDDELSPGDHELDDVDDRTEQRDADDVERSDDASDPDDDLGLDDRSEADSRVSMPAEPAPAEIGDAVENNTDSSMTGDEGGTDDDSSMTGDALGTDDDAGDGSGVTGDEGGSDDDAGVNPPPAANSPAATPAPAPGDGDDDASDDDEGGSDDD